MILALISALRADPCGMVWTPPWQPNDAEVVRSGGRVLDREGTQRTWIAYADGVETMVLRPGFSGSVDTFGMLIPFPSPPPLRKVDENVFSHVEAAVDPPAMTVDIEYPPVSWAGSGGGADFGLSGLRGSVLGASEARPAVEDEPELGFREVRILREEAVGMYELAAHLRTRSRSGSGMADAPTSTRRCWTAFRAREVPSVSTGLRANSSRRTCWRSSRASWPWASRQDRPTC